MVVIFLEGDIWLIVVAQDFGDFGYCYFVYDSIFFKVSKFFQIFFISKMDESILKKMVRVIFFFYKLRLLSFVVIMILK